MEKLNENHTCACDACRENQRALFQLLEKLNACNEKKHYKCSNPDCKYVADKPGDCCGVVLVETNKETACCGSDKKGCCD